MKHLIGLLAALWLPVLAAHGETAGATINRGVLPGGGAVFAQAQTAQAPPAAAPGPAGPVGERITVPAGTGILLKLPLPAATVMSADPTVARVQPASPTSLFLMGVEAGHTNIIATGDNGEAIVQYDVTVTRGGKPTAVTAPPAGPTYAVTAAMAATVQRNIARSVPGGSSVRAQAVGNDVILSGSVPNAIAAQQAEAITRAFVGDKAAVLNRMVVLSSIQVNVRVRVAEITRTLTQQLGFNWQVLNNNSFRFGLLTGAAATSPISALLPLGLSPFANVPPNQIGAGYSSPHWDINGIVNALAAAQLITILAEPNLTAQSGETASFLAGGEFPVPIAGAPISGTVTISVEFKTFGISLAVTPTVLSPTRLNLRVRPEVSQLSTQGAVNLPVGVGATLTIPALTVRRAETTIELGSGQSFAIAGLLEKTATENISGLPGLDQVPVIGRLFQSNDFQRGETELVIIVTPYLVQPASSPSEISAPAGDFRPATDLERVLYDRELAPYSYSRSPLPKLDAGFMLK